MINWFKKNYITEEQLENILEIHKRDILSILDEKCEMILNQRSAIIDPNPFYINHHEIENLVHHHVDRLRYELEDKYMRMSEFEKILKQFQSPELVSLSSKNIDQESKEIIANFAAPTKVPCTLELKSNSEYFVVPEKFNVESGTKKIHIPIEIKPISVRTTASIEVKLDTTIRMINISAGP